MSRYLDGEFDADLDTLHRIAAAFDHPVTALLDATTSAHESEAIELMRALRPASRELALQLLREWANPPVTRGRSRATRAASGGDSGQAGP